MLALALALALCLAAPAESAGRPKLLVLDISAGQGIDPVAVTTLTQAIAAEVARRETFEVITSREVQTVLSVERQKQLLGCGEDAASCLTELGGALGARFLLTGTLAQLGDVYTLSLQGVEAATAKTVGRCVRVVHSLAELGRLLPWAVAEATGLSPPEERTKAPSVSLFIVGAVGVLGGGLLGLSGLLRESEIAAELRLADAGNPTVLKPAQGYTDSAAVVGTLKTAGLVGVVGGAALIAVGALVFPRAPVAVALAPTPGGAALVAAGKF